VVSGRVIFKEDRIGDQHSLSRGALFSFLSSKEDEFDITKLLSLNSE